MQQTDLIVDVGSTPFRRNVRRQMLSKLHVSLIKIEGNSIKEEESLRLSAVAIAQSLFISKCQPKMTINMIIAVSLCLRFVNARAGLVFF